MISMHCMTFSGALTGVRAVLWLWTIVSVGLAVIWWVEEQWGPFLFAGFTVATCVSLASFLARVQAAIPAQPPHFPAPEETPPDATDG